jgi:5-methylcytosine-specific restriction endonuclease McrA
MKWRDIYFEIRYYPRRVLKYKSIWLWSSRMRKIRQKAKRARYRSKGYARLRNQKAKMKKMKWKHCLLCGALDRLTIDHIVPVSKGGTNSLSNLQVLCNDCNIKKGDNILRVEKPIDTLLIR